MEREEQLYRLGSLIYNCDFLVYGMSSKKKVVCVGRRDGGISIKVVSKVGR